MQNYEKTLTYSDFSVKNHRLAAASVLPVKVGGAVASSTAALSGTLAVGRYPASEVTDGEWNGAVWAKIDHLGGQYWVPLQAGVTGLSETGGEGCEEVRAQLERAQEQLDLTRQSLDWLLGELES